MEEKSVEKYLTKQVKKCGGLCLKFISPSMSGVPDRLILMPGARIFFAETKAKGRKPRPLQTAVHNILNRLGFRVFVVDCKEDIEKAIREMTGCEIHSA